jgi:hypothetical protein
MQPIVRMNKAHYGIQDYFLQKYDICSSDSLLLAIAGIRNYRKLEELREYKKIK